MSTSTKRAFRWILYSIYGKKCLRCGTSHDLTLDHVVPVSKGGKSVLENLQILCYQCNRLKKTIPAEYRKYPPAPIEYYLPLVMGAGIRIYKPEWLESLGGSICIQQ